MRRYTPLLGRGFDRHLTQFRHNRRFAPDASFDRADGCTNRAKPTSGQGLQIVSGGEQQRVAIARALVKDPAVILADGPTRNLDTANGDLVLDLLGSRCREAGAALLMATHAPLAAQRADRVLRMEDGTLAPAPAPTAPAL